MVRLFPQLRSPRGGDGLETRQPLSQQSFFQVASMSEWHKTDVARCFEPAVS